MYAFTKTNTKKNTVIQIITLTYLRLFATYFRLLNLLLGEIFHINVTTPVSRSTRGTN